jgi:hypothetical protein
MRQAVGVYSISSFASIPKVLNSIKSVYFRLDIYSQTINIELEGAKLLLL